MSDYWLIRLEYGSALIWKRKYFLGLFAIPWSLHGGTNIIRTPDSGPVLQSAVDYIKSQSSNTTQITVIVEDR